MKTLGAVLTLTILTGLMEAKTHRDVFPVPCDVLWRAVKDTVRNSGKYGIIGIDNDEMAISYNIGGALGGKRINSVVLNDAGNNTCEMQTQTAYSGLVHDDAGDFKKRVQASLEKELVKAAATPREKAASEPPPPPAAVQPATK